MRRHGFSACGKQRWYCPGCGRSWVIPGITRRRDRQRIWFVRWIQEGYSIRQLSQQSGRPPRTLRRIIAYWLDRPPDSAEDLSRHRHLLIDGTYLRGRRPAVTVVMDATANTVIAGAYDVHEAGARMAHFCAALADRGLCPFSITTDGQPRLLAYLRAQWPLTILQRCLVHIQRQGLMWCRRHPVRTDARHLWELFQQLSGIHTLAARDHWLNNFIAWEQRYGWKIELTPEQGYVFSDLKRARSLLVHALPDMFHYLERPGIVNNTNGLEGYFSRLKMRYRQHRGLSTAHRQSYIQWFLHLCTR